MAKSLDAETAAIEAERRKAHKARLREAAVETVDKAELSGSRWSS